MQLKASGEHWGLQLHLFSQKQLNCPVSTLKIECMCETYSPGLIMDNTTTFGIDQASWYFP